MAAMLEITHGSNCKGCNIVYLGKSFLWNKGINGNIKLQYITCILKYFIVEPLFYTFEGTE
jgi:hypothetical protein